MRILILLMFASMVNAQSIPINRIVEIDDMQEVLAKDSMTLNINEYQISATIGTDTLWTQDIIQSDIQGLTQTIFTTEAVWTVYSNAVKIVMVIEKPFTGMILTRKYYNYVKIHSYKGGGKR